MKASNVVATKAAKKEKPDLEEAMDASDDGEAEEIKVDDDATDLAKDKYVKQPKKKAAPKKAAAAKPQKSKGKKKKANDDDDDIEDESDEEVKPKPKGRGKAAAGAKGKKK